jgi:uncharacterized protein YprB with RNaseH-like and TPR domain
LNDKLRALGVNLGPEHLKPASTTGNPSLEEVLGGERRSTPLGEIFTIREEIPSRSPYGDFLLEIKSDLEIIAKWAGDESISALDPGDFLFVDTESTGLSGGTGTYAFLIGLGKFENEHFQLQQLFLRDPAEEAAQLFVLEEFSACSKALVSFNGKSFDLPLINSRFIQNRLNNPLTPLLHIDLLHISRRIWRDRLPSRTLGNIEAEILGAKRTDQDIPGWMVPGVYFQFLRDGNPEPVKNVLYHNRNDVLSLAILLEHIASILSSPEKNSSEFASDLLAIARIYEEIGSHTRAVDLYSEGLRLCQRDWRISGNYIESLQRLAQIHKRAGEYKKAIPLWEQAAEHMDIDSMIELAKYYEHIDKSIDRAIEWTDACLEILDPTPGDLSKEWLYEYFTKTDMKHDLEHRLNRLKRKAK